MRVLPLVALLFAAPAFAATHELKPTPQTVAWGHYDAADKPALTMFTWPIAGYLKTVLRVNRRSLR